MTADTDTDGLPLIRSVVKLDQRLLGYQSSLDLLPGVKLLSVYIFMDKVKDLGNFAFFYLKNLIHDR